MKPIPKVLHPAFLTGSEHEFAVRCQHCNRNFKIALPANEFGIICHHCHGRFSLNMQKILEDWQIKCPYCQQIVMLSQEGHKEASPLTEPTDSTISTMVVPSRPFSPGEEKLVEYFQGIEVKLLEATTTEASHLVALGLGLAGLVAGANVISATNTPTESAQTIPPQTLTGVLAAILLILCDLLPFLRHLAGGIAVLCFFTCSLIASSALYHIEIEVPIADLTRIRDLTRQLLRARGERLLQARQWLLLGGIATLWFLLEHLGHLSSTKFVYVFDIMFLSLLIIIGLNLKIEPIPSRPPLPVIPRSKQRNRLAIASLSVGFAPLLLLLLMGLMSQTFGILIAIPIGIIGDVLIVAVFLICGTLALWLGWRAKREIAQTGESGKRWAGCGIGCGYWWLLVSLSIIVWIIRHLVR